MKIITIPDPILRVPSVKVDDFGPDFQTLVTHMTWTLMVERRGVGLSAIQVGVPLRVMVYNTYRSTPALVNPRIVATNGILDTDDEGCLSCPNRLVAVTRPLGIKVRFQDRFGKNEEEQWFIGGAARIIAHEIDHMDGKLILDCPTALVNFAEECVPGGGVLS